MRCPGPTWGRISRKLGVIAPTVTEPLNIAILTSRLLLFSGLSFENTFPTDRRDHWEAIVENEVNLKMPISTHDFWQNIRITTSEFVWRTRWLFASPGSRSPVRRTPCISELEPRMLFSASPIDLSAIANYDDGPVLVETETVAVAETLANSISEGSSQQLFGEIVILDSAIASIEQMLDDLATSRPNAEVFVLDADRDGLEQISSILEQRSQISAIHIVSHAEGASIKLGSIWLNSANLDGYAGDLANWQAALTSDADLRLYGCELASSADGQTLLQSLAALTGADVAASVDDTGHLDYGANWELEFQVGSVDSDGVFSAEFEDLWHGKLAITTVTSTIDETLVNGETSLREAINQATSGDTIMLAAGTYSLSLAGIGEDSGLLGDLDIDKELTIIGSGTTTIIDGSGLDRIFEVHSAGNLTLRDLNLTGGSATGNSDHGKGGAIFVNQNSSILSLERVVVDGNIATQGGAIYNDGVIVLTDVVISHNGDSGTTDGGGIYNTRTATLERVTLEANRANQGGGIFNDNVITLTNVTLSGNQASVQGGGIYNRSTASLTNSTVAFNSANSGAGIRTQTGTLSLRNTIVAENQASNANNDIHGAVVSAGYNLIGDTTESSGFVNGANNDLLDTPAQLFALGNYGGFGKTHALASGSAALNAGTLASAPTVDARGETRDANPDIGAFEWTTIIFESTSDVLVNTVNTSGEQETSSQSRGNSSAIALADNGSYVVVWSTAQSGGGVFGRVFATDGSAITDEIALNQNSGMGQQWVSVASDAQGNFVATWTSSGQDGDDNGIYARRFNALGVPLDDEFRVNTTTTGAQQASQVAVDRTTGEFVIVWDHAGSGSDKAVYAQQFSATGVFQGPTEIEVDTGGTLFSSDPVVSMLNGGGFVVAWEDFGNIKVQKYDAAGQPSGVLVRPESFVLVVAHQVDLAVAPDNSFVVVWTENSSIRLQRYDSSEVLTGTTQTVNTTTAGTQRSPSIEMAEDGSFIVAWESDEGDSTLAVYGQKFNSDGSTHGGEFKINTTVSGNQQFVSLALADLQNFVAVWTGEGPGDSDGVFLRQFGTTDNSAPTNISPTTTSIDENIDTSSGLSVATLTASDINAGESFQFLIVGGADQAKFSIGGMNGDQLILTDGVLNYEAKSVYEVAVRVTDSASNILEATLTVTINDINEAPTLVLTPVVTSLSEAANTSSAIVVATIAITDDALGTETLSLSGTDAGLFELQAGGTELHLRANVSLNAASNPSLDVTVHLDDTAIGTGFEQTLNYSITVIDVNSAPTISMTPVLLAIAENTSTTAAIKVADIIVIDDGTGTNATSLVGPNASSFELQTGGTELYLRAGTLLDFESLSSLTLSIQVDDPSIPGTPDDSVSFTLAVQDANDVAQGLPVIQGATQVGATLTADIVSISDQDGLGTLQFQWLRSGIAIAGANSSSYTLSNADVGSTIQVSISFTDGGGNVEGPLTSNSTAVIFSNNTAPTLADSQVTALVRATITVPASNFLQHAQDLDGDDLTAILIAPPAVGKLTLMPSGEFSYTPEDGFVGRVVFTWAATDGEAVSNTATVTLNIIPALPPAGRAPQPPKNAPGQTADEAEDSAPEDSTDPDSKNETIDDAALTPVDSMPLAKPDHNDASPEVREATGSGSGLDTSSATAGKQIDIIVDRDSEPSGTAESRDSRANERLVGSSFQSDNTNEGSVIVAADYVLMTQPGEMWSQLDHQQETLESRMQGDLIIVGSTGVAASGFTVGFVAWGLRSGFLLSGLLAQIPAWRGIDPLLIMQSVANSGDGESLEELMDRRNQSMEETEDTDTNPE
jgi:hypothetical protein